MSDTAEMTWRVTRVDQTEHRTDLTFTRVDWLRDRHPDNEDDDDTEVAEPGSVGAFWVADNERVILSFHRHGPAPFHLGQHVFMRLVDIPNAPATELDDVKATTP